MTRGIQPMLNEQKRIKYRLIGDEEMLKKEMIRMKLTSTIHKDMHMCFIHKDTHYSKIDHDTQV